MDKSGVDKLIPVFVDLSKLSDIVKKDVYNAKIKGIEDKMPAIPNIATNTTLNAKVIGVKTQIPGINDLAATATHSAKINGFKDK